MTRVSDEFAKMGVRGISLLFASGDSGAGCDTTGKAFAPSFPASSPYVTAVGGTALSRADGEDASYISGGGFSNVFARPAYQAARVTAFLANATKLPRPSYYNHTGRGYPDVAAAAENFNVVVNRIPTPGVAGTSCASPTFSGVVATLNDVRIRSGKGPLGFLNPYFVCFVLFCCVLFYFKTIQLSTNFPWQLILSSVPAEQRLV